MVNPFVPSFGVIPKLQVGNENVIDNYVLQLSAGNPMYRTRMIYGVRGSGKTVMLRSIENQVKFSNDWIVIQLNVEGQDSLLSQLVAKLSKQMGFSLKNLLHKFKSISLIGGNGIAWDNTQDSTTAMMAEDLLNALKKQNKQLLVTLDEVYATASLKEFASQYQIWIGSGLPICLLFTGIPSQIDTLKNEKGMTFLWRTPKLVLEQINAQDVQAKYQGAFGEIDPLLLCQMSQLVDHYAFAFQVVGYVIWNKVDGNGSLIKQGIIDGCISDIKELLFNQSYIKIYQELTPQQHRFLKLIAHQSSSIIKTSDIVQQFKVGKNLQTQRSTVDRLRRKLINDQILQSPNRGQIKMGLPFFKDFLLDMDN